MLNNYSPDILTRDKLISVDRPWIMGILNLSPESFYANESKLSEKELFSKIETMIEEGVHIIDIGAVSTRPNSEKIDYVTEHDRLIPLFKKIRKAFPSALFSLDSTNDLIISESIELGIDIINDISGGNLMVETFKKIAAAKIPYILTYNNNPTDNTQIITSNPDIIKDSMRFFSSKIEKIHNLGCNDIILDLGFGFNKEISDNYKLLNYIDNFSIFNKHVLIGISRKSMIYKSLEIDLNATLNATSILNTFATFNNVSIVRVHDIPEAIQLRKLISLLHVK